MGRESPTGGAFMDSKELEIANWQPLPSRESRGDFLQDIPRSTGVYAIRGNKEVVRLFGKSDLIYIGKTENLRGGLRTRIRHLVTWERSDGHVAKKRIKRLCDAGINLEVGWQKSKKPRNQEMTWLRRYEKDHGELPPCNRQGSK